MRIRHIAAAVVLAAAVLALTTCSNPVDLVEAVTVEVMKANDRYLEVVDFSPENNDQSASPTGKITLIVDRAVDMDSVQAAIQFRNVTADSDVTWTFQYFPSTRSLVVQADSYLTENHNYSVTVSGLRGTDGSRMLQTLSFGFNRLLKFSKPAPSWHTVTGGEQCAEWKRSR